MFLCDCISFGLMRRCVLVWLQLWTYETGAADLEAFCCSGLLRQHYWISLHKPYGGAAAHLSPQHWDEGVKIRWNRKNAVSWGNKPNPVWAISQGEVNVFNYCTTEKAQSDCNWCFPLMKHLQHSHTAGGDNRGETKVRGQCGLTIKQSWICIPPLNLTQLKLSSVHVYISVSFRSALMKNPREQSWKHQSGFSVSLLRWAEPHSAS